MSALEKVIDRSRRLFSRNPKERAQAKLELWVSLKHRTARLTQRNSFDYLRMQNQFYELAASADHVSPGTIEGDFVVGSWKLHDSWPDYETYLLKYVPAEPVWTALEYGCGPGRNIRRFAGRFARIDGVDISRQNLINAERFLSTEIPREKMPKLFLTKGADVGDAPLGSYDFCFSTICLQHICVWEVRFSILKSLFGALKSGGRISIQMGYGPATRAKAYDANHVVAGSTNSYCDVDVQNPAQVEEDLTRIGFRDFEYWLRPPGPGDTVHQNWIFFTAVKR
jgi:SAM-dependent methyltransferase